MTTSGVTTIQLTRNELIAAALRKLGVIAAGQTPTTEDYTNGAQALNAVVSTFRALGMPMWRRTSYSWTPTTQTYTIGTGYTLDTDYPLKVYQAPFEYFTASTDTMDFPEEWYEPIIYTLATRLAPEWGIALPDRQELKREAKEMLDTVLGMGAEDGSLFFQPAR